MVTSNNLCITGRHTTLLIRSALCRSGTGLGPRLLRTLWLRQQLLLLLVSVTPVLLRSVVHAPVRRGRSALRSMRSLDVDICNVAAFLGQRLILVCRFGVLGDDVPCVNEAGDEAEAAEEDVDDGVGAADTALYPDYRVLMLAIHISTKLGYSEGASEEDKAWGGQWWTYQVVEGKGRPTRRERCRRSTLSHNIDNLMLGKWIL